MARVTKEEARALLALVCEERDKHDATSVEWWVWDGVAGFVRRCVAALPTAKAVEREQDSRLPPPLGPAKRRPRKGA